MQVFNYSFFLSARPYTSSTMLHWKQIEFLLQFLQRKETSSHKRGICVQTSWLVYQLCLLW